MPVLSISPSCCATEETCSESVVAPIVIALLYELVFGWAETSAKGHGAAFVFPGILFLLTASEAFNSTSYGIFLPRFSGAIYEIVSSPASIGEVMSGFLLAALTRVVAIAGGFLLVSCMCFGLGIVHPLGLFLAVVVSTLIFGMVGLIVGILAREFEQIPIFPAFVIMPLVFMGGTFIDIAEMPGLWPDILAFNPLAAFVKVYRFLSNGTTTGNAAPGSGEVLAICGVLLAALIILARLLRTNRHRRTFSN
ncbi:ABC transporter permease [Novosphingobium sp. MW5]|nr:ABC transporter permease [Novosphingobium sp. MW5]